MNKSICFVTATPATIDAFLRQHILSLAEDNIVTIVTDLRDGELSFPAHVIQKDFYISRKVSIWSDIKSLLGLLLLFGQSRFDLVVSVTPKAGLLAMISSFFCRIPVRIHWFTGQVWATKTGLIRSVLKGCDKITSLTATKLLADSQSQVDFIVQEKVASAKKLQMIHKGSISGVDLNRFSVNNEARVIIREQIGASSDDVLFLFLGRLNRDKGVLDLAVAFSALAESRGDIRLAFIGPDEEGLTEDISVICKPCIERVYFKGFTDKPEHFFSAADVFVLPSYREGFGTSVIEAAAAAVPCIGSDIYGLSDAIVDQQTGQLFTCGDVVALGKAMERLAQDMELRRVMGLNAKARVERDFDSKFITEKFVDYLKKSMSE